LVTPLLIGCASFAWLVAEQLASPARTIATITPRPIHLQAVRRASVFCSVMYCLHSHVGSKAPLLEGHLGALPHPTNILSGLPLVLASLGFMSV
jgi:hypothetical protein